MQKIRGGRYVGTFTFVLAAWGWLSVGATAADAVPAFVQQAATHAPSVSSLTVTTPHAIVAGDLLFATVGVGGSSAPTAASVTDSAGNRYTELLHFDAPDGTELSVWSAPVTAGGGTAPMVTATPSSTADVGVGVAEYSGLSMAADATAVDVTAQASGLTSAATTVTSGATPPVTAAGELAVGTYVDSGFGDTLGAGTGWTERSNVSTTSDMELLSEDQVLTSGGGTASASVATGGNTTWLMATVVFKSSGPAPPPTAPQAPTGVTATAGDGSATVSWTAPPNGGSAITSYTVTPYIGTTAQPATTVTGSPPATSATVSGLTDGTSYTFTVRASNGVGDGPQSTPSSAVIPQAAGAAPLVDPSTPAITGVPSNVTTVVSNAFSPPAGSVLYATFSMDSVPSTDPNPSVASVTNTGAALTWHRMGAANQTGSGVGGYVEVWWAYNPTAQANIAITGNLAQPTKNIPPPPGAVGVIVMRGAAADQSAAAWSAGYESGAVGQPPSATVRTTRPNSVVLAVANNWDSSVAPTPATGQTTTIAGRSAVVLNPADEDTYWDQALTAPVASPGTVTMSDTAPTVRYHMVAWEVLAAGGTPSTAP